jgi:hypothetical protein
VWELVAVTVLIIRPVRRVMPFPLKSAKLRIPSGAAALALVFSFAGCGGVEDPFERVDVAGTVNIDGKPLPYGELLFKGKPNDKDEAAQAFVEVRDGKFSTENGAKPGPGENTVTLTVYDAASPPAAESEEEFPVKGMWQTTKTLKADEPVAFDVKSSELKKDL